MQALEVFWVFLKLGVTSFGGPVAHFGYFRREFVEKRDWLNDSDYASLIGLCQFLPGPGSSQTGFGIGLLRAGWLGGIAAWVGFTLPSAGLMFTIAMEASTLEASAAGQKLLHGLQLATLAVVAQAVWTMANSLCQDFSCRTLGVIGLLVVILLPGTEGQILALAIGGLVGRYLLDRPAKPPAAMAAPGFRLSHKVGVVCVGIFILILLATLTIPGAGNWGLFSAFYRTGALVFGGGHVVLPLLNDAIVLPGWVSSRLFLAGYGAAQAMPGPLFTIAAYLGALATPKSSNLAGAGIALMAIFLPGLLLVAGILPFWHGLRNRLNVVMTMRGLNSIVVGIMGFALLNLVMLGSMRSVYDLMITLAACWALMIGKMPPILVVGVCALVAVIT
ncbi:MAG: chromate efflux transporter [Acidocella sp.]|nr:chromate efflux transporter [Acidocella sp.]